MSDTIVRNPAYNAVGGIDCEINHPTLGWIPFSASADDPEVHGRAIHATAQAMGPAPYVPPPPPPPPPPTIADISRQQCAMRMCQMGLIGPEDMVAMAQSGTPPAMVENMLGAMPEPDQSFARAAFAKNTYSRKDPLLVLMMTGQPVPVPGGDPRPATADDIDQFFRDAALL
ncbi:hypothetical protein GCM10019059_34990 [Camelimonas fluminis]|uniref:Uncharacterized protein n=1 Tax=Camelimonas fluminis TaxID=1576911 RepID=A0ABV7UHL4_9HYPH|nr:hypothetical protein [Camelimonas fluminis]GHE72327.1 hypothetical protein GCM10019059_34990 [Camelimonas fluminis]